VNHPLVSVIMPAYNASGTIEEAVRSALEQTYPAIEIIVVDDGSGDGTAQLVRSIFGDAVHLEEAPHTGRGAARNLGLSKAGGEYIQYLDADDAIAPLKVAQQVWFLQEHPEFAGVYGNVEAFSDIDAHERWPFRPEITPEGDVLPSMIESGFLLPVGTLVRTDWSRRVGGFDPSLESNEDWDHWLRVAAWGGRFAHWPKEGYVGFYRVRGGLGGTARSATVHLRTGILALERLERLVDRETATRLRVRRSIGHWRFGYGRSLLLQGDRSGGVRQIARSLCEDRRHALPKLTWLVLGRLLGGQRARAVIDRIRPGAGGAPESD
jgi:glycosyltransferase involved in cell wall biosynthesis